MILLPHDYLEAVVRTLRDRGVRFAPGLTESEFTAAEEAHDFQFPPDLRSLLEHALPVGKRFPDWREPDSAFIADRLAGRQHVLRRRARRVLATGLGSPAQDTGGSLGQGAGGRAGGAVPHPDLRPPVPDEPREIEFWSELERLNG